MRLNLLHLAAHFPTQIEYAQVAVLREKVENAYATN